MLRGALGVESDHGILVVRAGHAAIVRSGERVRYSTPEADGAEYIAVCLPEFSLGTVHREES